MGSLRSGRAAREAAVNRLLTFLPHLLALFVGVYSAQALGCRCVEEGGRYSHHQRGNYSFCCPGLSAHQDDIMPSEGYMGDDYPEGCGMDPESSPNLLVCLACGDGECTGEEDFCNCSEDCEQGETGTDSDAQ